MGSGPQCVTKEEADELRRKFFRVSADDERQYAKQQYDSTETTVEPQLDAPFGALRGKTFVKREIDRAVGPGHGADVPVVKTLALAPSGRGIFAIPDVQGLARIKGVEKRMHIRQLVLVVRDLVAFFLALRIQEELVSAHDIPRFHKIALRDMAAHDIVHKYGQVIGEATAPIKRGDYVHIHNIESIKTGVER